MRLNRLLIPMAALMIAIGCKSDDQKGKTKKYQITFETTDVNDSKKQCGGGISTQTVKIKNLTKKTQNVFPSFSVPQKDKVEILNAPKLAVKVDAGKTESFTCDLRDFGDPPDGTKKGAKTTLTVSVDGQKESTSVKVVCTKGIGMGEPGFEQ